MKITKMTDSMKSDGGKDYGNNDYSNRGQSGGKSRPLSMDSIMFEKLKLAAERYCAMKII